MKNSVIISIIVLVIILGGVIFFSLNMKPDTDREAVIEGDYNIEINNFAFNPETLTIKIGETVVWTNQDFAKHTITSDTGTELDSASLSKGQSYSHTFNEAGEFLYHCANHPSMTATIIVE